MDKIHTAFILEILGRPEDHVKQALNELVKKLSDEEGVNILREQFFDPRKVEDSKDLFTAFAEIEAEVDTIDKYFGVLFAYMPSNVEIISPEKLSVSNLEFNEVGTRLMHRLHEYDAIAKNMLFEKELILKELKKSSPDFYKKITTPPEEKKQPEDKEKGEQSGDAV